MPRYLCNKQKYLASINFNDDRKKAEQEFATHGELIETTAHTNKTLSQNSAIWRDFQIAGRLLYMSKEQIYTEILIADEFDDLFYLPENVSRRTGEVKPRYRTLSELSKEETSEFIPRYREYLQAWINDQYGEIVPVDWSRDEEKEKQYWDSRYGIAA